MRRPTIGVATAVAGLALSGAAIIFELLAASAPVCRPTAVTGWLIAMAMGPLLAFVGVALYVEARTKQLGDWAS